MLVTVWKHQQSSGQESNLGCKCFRLLREVGTSSRPGLSDYRRQAIPPGIGIMLGTTALGMAGYTHTHTAWQNSITQEN